MNPPSTSFGENNNVRPGTRPLREMDVSRTALRRILIPRSPLRYSWCLTPRGWVFVDWENAILPSRGLCPRVGTRRADAHCFPCCYLRFVPDNRLYKLHKNGAPVDGYGPYEEEENLIDALVEINRASQLEWGQLVVHVYKTDATPLGIGRKYLGAIDGGTVLMMGEVDEERVQQSR